MVKLNILYNTVELWGEQDPKNRNHIGTYVTVGWWSNLNTLLNMQPTYAQG